MNFDAATAQLLLAAGLTMDRDKFVELYKQFKDIDGSLDPKMVVAAESLKDKRVGLKHSSYTGTVVGPNLKSGIYGGSRFPLLIRIDETNLGKKGEVFEYTFDDIYMLDEPGINLKL
jgi:hypothetical protein